MNTMASPRSVETLLATVSASRLATFHQCRLKFYFQYVLGLPRTKSAALHVGTTLHATLQYWNKARWRRLPLEHAQLQKAFEESWREEQKDQPIVWEEDEEKEIQAHAWALLKTYRERIGVASGNTIVSWGWYLAPLPGCAMLVGSDTGGLWTTGYSLATRWVALGSQSEGLIDSSRRSPTSGNSGLDMWHPGRGARRHASSTMRTGLWCGFESALQALMGLGGAETQGFALGCGWAAPSALRRVNRIRQHTGFNGWSMVCNVRLPTGRMNIRQEVGLGTPLPAASRACAVACWAMKTMRREVATSGRAAVCVSAEAPGQYHDSTHIPCPSLAGWKPWGGGHPGRCSMPRTHGWFLMVITGEI